MNNNVEKRKIYRLNHDSIIYSLTNDTKNAVFNKTNTSIFVFFSNFYEF